ncbi:hypothetical protein ACLB2K_077378 [Fragaria x ananassa]
MFIGTSANEGSSKYIPPNESPRGNPKVRAQKTPQFALGAGTSKTPPPRNSGAAFLQINGSPCQGAGTPDDPVIAHSSPAPKNIGQVASFSTWPNHEEGAESTPVTAADWHQLISNIVKEQTEKCDADLQYRNPYPDSVAQYRFPHGFKNIVFTTFSGEIREDATTHMTCFKVQCGQYENNVNSSSARWHRKPSA